MTDPIRQIAVMDKEYVSIKDLGILYGWGRATATREFKKCVEEGAPVFQSGKALAIPIDKILKKYPISYARLERAVKRKALE